MTIEDMYALLRSKTFFQEEGLKKYNFNGNNIQVDRRPFIPYEIYREKEDYYLSPDSPIAGERELRIVIDNEAFIHFYGKSSGERLLTLQ